MLTRVGSHPLGWPSNLKCEGAGYRGLTAAMRDRLFCLEISQDLETGGSTEKVFHCVPAQHEPRIDGVVVELEHLGERVERDRDEPVD